MEGLPGRPLEMCLRPENPAWTESEVRRLTLLGLAVLVGALALGTPGPADARTRKHRSSYMRVHQSLRKSRATSRHKPSPKPPARKPSGTTVERPRYEDADRLLVVPFKGPQPAYTRGTLRLPPRLYFDFDADAPKVGSLNEVVFDHPTWLGWTFAPHGGIAGRARVTFIFKRPTSVAVTVDAKHHALLLMPAQMFLQATPTPLPLPSPTPTPEPSPTPTPEPSPTPTPTPVPTPTPTPTPTPRPTPPPPRLRVGMPVWTYDEDDAAAGVAVHADSVPALEAGLRLDGLLQGWSADLSARSLGLTYTDGTNALHARQEWDAGLVAWHALNTGAIATAVGLAYDVRVQTAASSGSGTGFGFVPWRVAHGPTALGTLRLPVIDSSGWDVRLTGGVAPALFNVMPADTPALPWLWGYRLEAALDAPLGPLDLALGYRRMAYTGDGYAEIFQGPFVTLGGPIGR